MDIVIVDTETTGLDAFEDEVVEVSILRMSHDDLIRGEFSFDDIYTYRIRPSKPERAFRVPVGSTLCAADINGFSVERWEQEAVRFPLYDWEQFMYLITKNRLLEGAKWCGANAQFDYTFFNSLCRRNKIFMPRLGSYHLVDLSTFGHFMKMHGQIEKATMDAMAKFFGISGRASGQHSSIEDVYIAAKVYQGIFRDLAMQTS